MKKTRVRDIMVPLSDYATVSKEASLLDAIRAMESRTKKHDNGPYRHRAVLVLDGKDRVVGKLSQVDIMRALEPNYRKIGADVSLSRFGFSSGFIAALREQYKLWERPLEELCKALEQIPVTEVMYSPADHQRVGEDDSLDMAMHQIVMGRHQSLLVTQGKKITGILRSTDVFNALYKLIQECEF